MKIKDFRLSVKLIVGGLLAVLISMGSVGLISVKIASNALLTIGLDNSKSIAAYMAKATQSYVELEMQITRAMGISPVITDTIRQVARNGTQNSMDSLTDLDRYLKEVHEKVGKNLDLYFVADREGNTVADSLDGTMRQKKINILDRGYFSKAMQTGQPVIGVPIKSRASGAPSIVLAIPLTDGDGGFVGVFGAVLKLSAMSESLTGFKVGKTGYPFIVDSQGVIIAHPNSDLLFDLNIKSLKGMENISSRMLAGENGGEYYIFKGKEKQAGYASVPLTGWSIAVTQNMDELMAHVNKIILYSVLIGIVILMVVSVVLYFAANAIVKPINQAVSGLKAMAEGEGDLTQRLPVSGRDEVGLLSYTFNIFIEKLQSMISDISHGVHTLSASSTQLAAVSEEMSAGAANTSEKAGSVAAAAEEMTMNMTSVSAAMEESANNINMVASAAQQMNSTIDAIGKNTGRARDVAANAVNSVEQSAERMRELGAAAQAIGQVVETITDISEQVNLLSLNATIEAARAGEAGKGFAVVANEIKELASQTSNASQDIKDKIDHIQQSASGSMAGMGEVTGVIGKVSEIVSEIAAAVEEQSAATHEINENIAHASSGVEEVNQNVGKGALVAEGITRDISRVNQSAENMTLRSQKIQISAEELSSLAERLDELVGQFKI